MSCLRRGVAVFVLPVLCAVPAIAALPQQAGTVDLLTQANIQLDGAAGNDRTGGSVAGAGDVNGDGRADVIVSAIGASNNMRTASGSAYVIFGVTATATVDLAGLGTGGFRIDGAAPFDGVGTVAGAGDVNGDGRADVIVGANQADNNGRPGSGSAYVVFGKADTAAVDLASLGTGGFRIDGAVSTDQLGAVAGAGDVNGDGWADVIVGAPQADNVPMLGDNSGSSYVVFGKASTATVDLASLGTAGFRIRGAATDDFAGRSVSGAGDVNGDGRADVVVGADRNALAPGSGYVVFGKSDTTTVDLASLGAGGFRMEGPIFLGGAVAGAGDVNGDGRADVILGAPFDNSSGRPNSGSGYVIFGKADTATVNLTSLGAGGFRIDGAANNDNVGGAVAGASDVNGDGRADVILGARQASANGRTSSGSGFVVFGKSDTTTVDLAALGAGGFRMDGAAPNDAAGISVAGAGDVNGDGRGDVIVGADFADNNLRAFSGSAYVAWGVGTPELSYPQVAGAVGRPLAVTPSVRRTGTASFSLSAGALPAGLSLDASTGVISGTPKAAASGSVTVTMTDLAGSVAASVPIAIAKALVVSRRATASGFPILGQRLTCAVGLTGKVTSRAVTWRRGTRVVATTALYRIRAKDLGNRISCSVTATGPGGAATSTSPRRLVPRRCVVASTRGLTLRVARTRLGNRGCRTSTLRTPGLGVPAGRVLGTAPSPGTSLANGAVVTIRVRR